MKMITDRILGQPIWSLLKISAVLFPFAMLGLFVARFLPSQYSEWVWPACFAFVIASLVFFTPYLMLAEFCFYLMSQRPFPKSTAIAIWLPHVLLLLAVAFCLWRTWVLWPGIRQKDLPVGAKNAPWWGYVLGGIAAFAIYALMAYFFHFQE
jgi:hypothetical protein